MLTSLISQALLQAALDKVTEVFSGCMLLYEFPSSPSNRYEPEERLVTMITSAGKSIAGCKASAVLEALIEEEEEASRGMLRLVFYLSSTRQHHQLSRHTRCSFTWGNDNSINSFDSFGCSWKNRLISS
jgi:hypothetical protein